MRRKIFLLLSTSIFLIPIMTDCSTSKNKVSDLRWQFKTDDTHMTIEVVNNRQVISELKNPGNGWNWTPEASEVPLLNRVKVGLTTYFPNWKYQEAVTDTSDGYTVTLRFASTKPKLELKSNWRARKGCGPVEHWMTVENKTGGNIIYDCADIISSNLTSRADTTVTLWRFDREPVGRPPNGVFKNRLEANSIIVSMVQSAYDLSDRSDAVLPFLIMDVVSTHGLYIGYGWDFGMFVTSIGNDRCIITNRFNLANANPVEIVEENGKILNIPYTFYGTYIGDADDGSNKMKKWFWNYRMTRTMRENNDEPLVELHVPFYDEAGWINYLKEHPLKSWGVDLIKMDLGWLTPGTPEDWGKEISYTKNWNPDPVKWPNGLTFGKIAHENNLKASLYMCNTYLDVDLATEAGRSAEREALLERYDKGWYDYYRSDFQFEAHNNYLSHEGFLGIIDHMIANRPGFRWENCSGGGHKKSLDIAERMTFVTTEDYGVKETYRLAFYGNSYVFNPVQLKADINLVPQHNTSIAWDKYIFRNGLMGAMMPGSDPRIMDEQEEGVARETWNLYQTKQRAILRGADVYHILPFPDGVNWDGIQFFNTDINKGSVLLFKPSGSAPDTKFIKLKGLDKNETYTLTFQDRKEQNTRITGAELMDTGIEIKGMSGNFASEIIWIN